MQREEGGCSRRTVSKVGGGRGRRGEDEHGGRREGQLGEGEQGGRRAGWREEDRHGGGGRGRQGEDGCGGGGRVQRGRARWGGKGQQGGGRAWQDATAGGTSFYTFLYSSDSRDHGNTPPLMNKKIKQDLEETNRNTNSNH